MGKCKGAKPLAGLCNSTLALASFAFFVDSFCMGRGSRKGRSSFTVPPEAGLLSHISCSSPPLFSCLTS